MHQWHELIMDESQTRMTHYYDYCCPSLIINQMTTRKIDGLNRDIQFALLIEEVWPESIRERIYGQNVSNTLTKFTVSFSFKKWRYIRGFGQSGELTNQHGDQAQFGDRDEFGSLVAG